MKKSVVVLGGNKMACPAIERIQKHGFQVVVVDANSTAPARELADRFVHQDFSDAAATETALTEIQFDGIILLNDFAIRSAAQIARKRELPGWTEFAQRCFTSKVAMKGAWLVHGVPTARHLHLSG